MVKSYQKSEKNLTLFSILGALDFVHTLSFDSAIAKEQPKYVSHVTKVCIFVDLIFKAL
jgi:hypothetical protein